jgi:hypothetical protein
VGVAGQDLTKTTDGRTAFDPANGWLVNDGTKNRVLIGKRKDGTYGIDVSKNGQEVVGAGGSQLVMSSQFNSFKIVGTGTATIVIPNPNTVGGYSVAIPHGLGFTPGVLAYVNSFGGIAAPGVSNIPLPTFLYNGAALSGTDIPILGLLGCSVDSTNINIQMAIGVVNSTYPGTWTFRYYLTQETAN